MGACLLMHRLLAQAFQFADAHVGGVLLQGAFACLRGHALQLRVAQRQACKYVVRGVYAQHFFAGGEEGVEALPAIAEQGRAARCSFKQSA